MKFFDIAKKYGTATYNYPFEPYEVFDGFRGKPAYKYEACIGCTACGVACPSNAINVKLNEAQDKVVWEFNCGRCIFCGRCDEVCPTGAVYLTSEFELAVKFDNSALIQRGELDVEYCKCCQRPFTTKRLIKYAFERMERAIVGQERLDQAKEYLHVCPECKKEQTVTTVTNEKNGEWRVK